MTTVSMESTTDQLESDRIALRRMFRAIADYGRQVRLRRQSKGEAPVQETQDIPTPENKIPAVPRRKYRKRKVGS
jgi:hypothetical protein